jgi:hypothetical protein
MNDPWSFRSWKSVMEKEIFSILDSKNTAKIFALRPDD